MLPWDDNLSSHKTYTGLQITVVDQSLPVIFALSPINFFELFSEMLLEYWLSNFQFCVEVKPVNYYSSVSTLVVSSLDIKQSILV